MFDNTWDDHPLEDWEWWFGDSPYANCDKVMAKYVREDGGVLTQYQVFINRCITFSFSFLQHFDDSSLVRYSEVNYWRQRVEHIMGVIKKHAVFRQNYRGSHFFLQAMVQLTVHMTSCSLRKSWIDEEGKCRYPGFNYGAHDQY